jgi:integrase
MALKKRRRAHGSGSIYQVKDGAWIAQERIDGKLIRRRAPDEPAAKLALNELQELKAKQIDVRGGAQPVQDWAHACLLEMIQLRHPKPRTIEFARRMLERYIIPLIGTMPLLDVRPTHLQGVISTIYTGIRDEGVYDGARTAHGVGGMLDEIFTLAHQRKLILDNPYVGIILPVYHRKEVLPLTDQQLRDLLAAAAGEIDRRPAYTSQDGKTKRHPPLDRRLAPLWWAYAFLGLRRGEGLGLCWAGYDGATIAIEQQVQRLAGEVVLSTLKTPQSVRRLPVGRRLAAQLDTLDRAHDLIFPSQAGTPMWPDNLEAQFRKLRAAAGLPDTVKLHHLRHTLSTLLDECGASESITAAILGHAKQTQTQHYTHARIETMRTVLQAVEDRILG